MKTVRASLPQTDVQSGSRGAFHPSVSCGQRSHQAGSSTPCCREATLPLSHICSWRAGLCLCQSLLRWNQSPGKVPVLILLSSVSFWKRARFIRWVWFFSGNKVCVDQGGKFGSFKKYYLHLFNHEIHFLSTRCVPGTGQVLGRHRENALMGVML